VLEALWVRRGGGTGGLLPLLTVVLDILGEVLHLGRLPCRGFAIRLLKEEEEDPGGSGGDPSADAIRIRNLLLLLLGSPPRAASVQG
jgi:hypothetical protein